MHIRNATAADLRAITLVYSMNVLLGTGSFETAVPDEAEMGRRVGAIDALGLPWLVAEIGGSVVGYAYAGPFRVRPAYRFTVEDSIYVAPDAIGRGVGKALLASLIERCEALGKRQMLAVIGDSGNTASIQLHLACGFERIGTMSNIGWKLDRWLDVVLMQRTLGAGATSAPSPGFDHTLAISGSRPH